MSAGLRWRLVEEQGGRTHVSSVVLAEHEVDVQLAAEATLHAVGGWAVTPGIRVVICRHWQTGTVRTIRAVAFDPMHDSAGVS